MEIAGTIRDFKAQADVDFVGSWRSLWQTDAAHQILETRVRMQAVEFGINFQEGQEHGTVRVGLFERGQGLLLVAEADINLREIISGNVALLGTILELLQDFFSLAFLP